MRKNPHDRILKGKSKEQHLSIVPKPSFGSRKWNEMERK